MKKYILGLIGIVVLAIGFTGAFRMMTVPQPEPSESKPEESKPITSQPTDTSGVVCAADAKLCPNGSYVSRTGPKCEFAACPNTTFETGCTKEAKLCPDGSYVSRTGPKCEFTACPTTSTTSGTYIWKWVKFTYPNDWVLEESFYRTPAQEAEGLPAEVVGFYLKPKKQNSLVDSISVGGRQFSCQVASSGGRCVEVIEGIPVYTKSIDPKVLSVFDILISSAVHVK